MKIHYLDAPAGAGKTYALVKEAINMVENEKNVLIIQPIQKLIDQTVENIKKEAPSIEVKVITQETISSEQTVGGALTEYLKQPYYEAHVLIITWTAFVSLPFAAKKYNWNVLVDEIPQCHLFYENAEAQKHNIVTNHVVARQTSSSYSQLEVKKHSQLRKIAINKKTNVVFEDYKSLARTLISDNWNSFVSTADFADLINNPASDCRLTVYSILKPSIFAGYESVVIAGALFKDSLFYHAFTKQGVQFIERWSLKGSLKYTEHQNGHLARFLYCTNKLWSKTYRNQNDKVTLNTIVDGSFKAMNDKEFIWAANNDIIDNKLFGQAFEDKRLPNYAHGLNAFTSYDNVIYLTASNLKADQSKFLEEHLSVDREAINIGVHFHAAYQTVLRSSLRNPDSLEHKTIFVPDYFTASRLHSCFPNSTLEMVDFGLDQTVKKAGRIRIHASDTDKVKKHRLRRSLQLLEPWFAETGVSLVPTDDCNENTLLKDNIVTIFRASVFTSKKSKNTAYWVVTETLEEFEYLLEYRSREMVLEKEKNLLFSPALFDPSLAVDTNRGFANVVMTTSIWLDFDGGDLLPDEFAGMFPSLRMTIYNTYSSTKEKLRYRVYIPANGIISPSEYKDISASILDTVRSNGYVDTIANDCSEQKAHGIDMGKLGPASLFYLPCQPKDSNGQFFKIYKDDGRVPLNVEEWVYQSVATVDADSSVDLPSFVPDYESMSESRREVRVRSAIEKWHIQCCKEGNGNEAFFDLVCGLEYAGCELCEIEQILYEQAKYAIHPNQRLLDIPRIMKRLSANGGRFRLGSIDRLGMTPTPVDDAVAQIGLVSVSL